MRFHRTTRIRTLTLILIATTISFSLISYRVNHGAEPPEAPNTSTLAPVAPNQPFQTDAEDSQLDRRAKELANQFRTATPDEKIALRKQLEEFTEKQFEYRQRRRQEQFEQLGQRVEQLKTTHARRKAHKLEIIQRRVNELLDLNGDLEWENLPSVDADSIAPRVSEQGASESKDVVSSQSDSFATRATRSSIEPKYDGVTLSEWMELLATERNPKKVAEGIAALNHLIDHADPRSLSRQVFRMLRLHDLQVQGLSQIPNDIACGCAILLLRLPPDLVVDGIANELTTNLSRGGTRQFLVAFFQLVGGQVDADSQRRFRRPYSILSNVGGYHQVHDLPSVRTDELQPFFKRLKLEIRHSSSQLIDLIVDAVTRDESLAGWGIESARQIKDDLPLTRYPKLVPLVEDAFQIKRSIEKTLATRSPLQALTVVTMLGESGLKLEEIFQQANQQIGANGAFEQGIDSLGIISAHSNEALNRVHELLRSEWNAIAAIQDAAAAKAEISAAPPTAVAVDATLYGRFDQIQRCCLLIDVLDRIGAPAKSSLELLREIANSPRSSLLLPPEGGMGRPLFYRVFMPTELNQGNVTVKTLAERAIQSIENAKPKAPPEPLPAIDDSRANSTTSTPNSTFATGNATEGLNLQPSTNPSSALRLEYEVIRWRGTGQKFTVQLKASNQGNEVAKQLVIENELPPSIKLSGTQPRAEVSGRKLKWSFDSLKPKQSITVSLAASPPGTGVFTFRGTIRSANAGDYATSHSVQVDRIGGSSIIATEETTPPKVEPTYKGMKLSQALRTLNTERDRETVTKAIYAVSNLLDQGDATEITRAILGAWKYQDPQNRRIVRADEGASISLASDLIFLRLPGEIVLEQLFAELPSLAQYRTSRDFCLSFFNTIAEIDFAGFWDPALISELGPDLERLPGMHVAWKSEIQSQCDRLIGAVVSTASQNDELRPWAGRTIISILRISKRPLSAFPESVPFVERVLNDPPANNFSDAQYHAAVLLGQSCMKVAEVLEFAKKRMQSKGMEFEYRSGIDCLVAILPFERSVNEMLRDELRVQMKDFREVLQDLGAKNISHDEAYRVDRFRKAVDRFSSIAKSMAVITNPSGELLAPLKEVAENEEFNLFSTPGTNQAWNAGNGVRFAGPSMKQVVDETLKQIEQNKALPAKASTPGF